MAMTDEERYDLYEIQEVMALVLSLLADISARRMTSSQERTAYARRRER